MKKLLHVGCGPLNKLNIKGFINDWQEVRYDIDPNVIPDIIGTLTDMYKVASESFDALYSSHNIEHLYPHEVPIAIKEFYRILNQDGFVIITCPDLQSVGKELASGRLIDPLYFGDAGPIAAIDIIYGHRGFISNGNSFMAHKSGFTFDVLSALFYQAGFAVCHGAAIPQDYSIWLLAFKSKTTSDNLIDTAKRYLP